MQRIMRMREKMVLKCTGLNIFHKSKDIIAGANASGKVYLWKNNVSDMEEEPCVCT